MFCPVCRSEYRPGFTRCAPCDVDLVADLDSATIAPNAPTGGVPAGRPVDTAGPFVDYCGFVDLDEARTERDRLRERGVVARISIRETPPGHLDGPIEEEYWLRVPRDLFPKAATVLGYDALEETSSEDFACAACGAEVPAEAERCPACGVRFEDGP